MTQSLQLAITVDLSLLTYHLPPRRKHLPRSRYPRRQPRQRQRVRRDEIETIILGHLPHDLGRPQRLTPARLVVLLQHGLELGQHRRVLGLHVGPAPRLEAHADADVERAEPDGVDVRDRGEDGVEVVDRLDGFDLDHDGGLAVEVLVQGRAVVAAQGRDAGDEAEGGHGAGAVVFGAEFGGGDDVEGFGDGVDLCARGVWVSVILVEGGNGSWKIGLGGATECTYAG